MVTETTSRWGDGVSSYASSALDDKPDTCTSDMPIINFVKGAKIL